MNLQTLPELVIAPQNGSERHALTRRHEGIQHRNGTLYNKPYWAMVEKYDFTVLSSKINLRNLSVYYDIIKDTYILRGNISLVGDKVGVKREGYYFDDGSESYIDSGWSSYTEHVKLFMDIDQKQACDLGTISGFIARDFIVDLGSVKPDAVSIAMRCAGPIESNKPDIAGTFFGIAFDGILATETLSIPAMTIVPNKIALDPVHISRRVFERNHDNQDVPSDETGQTLKSWRWAYKLDFTTGILIDGIEINYANGVYTLTGNMAASYDRITEESIRWQDTQGVNTLHTTTEWTGYNDSACTMKLYLNNTVALDMGAIEGAKDIDTVFTVNLGSAIPSDFILTLRLDGEILATHSDAIGDSFSLNKTPSVISISRVVMPFTVSSETASADIDLFSLPSASKDILTTTQEYIEKRIGVFGGWRYMIGVRDIDIRNRKYETHSDMITKKFETNKPISKIVLYSNEVIPQRFIDTGLENRNEWIKYYISINDTDWHRISPMHHNQVGNLKIAPKIYEINSKDSPEEKLQTINKGYIASSKDVNAIRLKVTLSRPDGMEDLTPIIEEYALKCILEEEV